MLNPAFRGLNASDFEVIQLGWRGSAPIPPGPCQPAAPSDLWATVSGYDVQVGWTPPSGTWLGHRLDVGSSTGLTNITSLPVAAPGSSLAAQAPAGRYYLRVRAASACGDSPASNEVVLDVPSGCNIPAAPGPFTASVSGRTVSLQWGAAGSAASYELLAGSAPGLSNLLVSNRGAVTALTTVAPPGRYYVRVRGVGACGHLGPASNEVIVVVQ